MRSRDRLYLEHVLECIERIERYTQGGEAEFRSETLIQDAVVRNLQLIGESAKRIDEGVLAAAPTIPWRTLAGLRNILVHEYLGVDQDRIWEIVSQDLGKLRHEVETLLHAGD